MEAAARALKKKKSPTHRGIPADVCQSFKYMDYSLPRNIYLALRVKRSTVINEGDNSLSSFPEDHVDEPSDGYSFIVR